jgi:hypothetical protein
MSAETVDLERRFLQHGEPRRLLRHGESQVRLSRLASLLLQQDGFVETLRTESAVNGSAGSAETILAPYIQ